MPRTQESSHEKRNKTLIRSFMEEIFKHNLSSIDRYFGKDVVEGSPQAWDGGEGFKRFLINFFRAFSDMHIAIEHIVTENDLVVVFLNGSGTHKGEFRGVQPTN